MGATWAPESLLRSHWGLETAPRALREASRRPQECSGRLQDGFRSAPGGLKAATRSPQEVSRRLQELPGRLQDGSHRRSSLSRWEFPLQASLKQLSITQVAHSNKSDRRSCSCPLNSHQLASGQLAPCMSMHGFTLVSLYNSRAGKDSDTSSDWLPTRAMARIALLELASGSLP